MPRPTWATRRSVLAVGTGCASRRWVVTRNVCVNEASKGKLATKKCLAPSPIVRAMAFAFEANVCAWLDLKGTIVQNNSRATWMATTPTLNVQVMVHATLANVIAMPDGNPTRVNAIKN